MNDRRASGLLILAGLSGPLCLLAGCSDNPPAQPDGGSLADTGAFDGVADGALPDADESCVCRPDARGAMGQLPLPCLCAMSASACPSYNETPLTCKVGYPPDFNRIDTHAACNLVAFHAADSFSASEHVFDATTHELVGASFSSDSNMYTCGSARVFGYRAGIFPPSDCPVSQSSRRCPEDGGPRPDVFDDAMDASPMPDGGCTCARSDAGIPNSTAEIALPCYCSRPQWPSAFMGRPPCSSYDELVGCPDGGDLDIYVETYTNCNLVTVGHGLFNAVDLRVYDTVTHELVGAMRGDDYPSIVCDLNLRVNMLRTGTVPGNECTLAKRQQPCRPRDDGGDATPE